MWGGSFFQRWVRKVLGCAGCRVAGLAGGKQAEWCLGARLGRQMGWAPHLLWPGICNPHMMVYALPSSRRCLAILAHLALWGLSVGHKTLVKAGGAGAAPGCTCGGGWGMDFQVGTAYSALRCNCCQHAVRLAFIWCGAAISGQCSGDPH